MNSSDMFFLGGLAILALFIGWFVRRARRRRRERYIENYRFHHSICNKFREKHPQLNDEQLALVFRGLRDYFQMCLTAGKRMVAMPSQVVDDAWHEFILFTRAYEKFCDQGLGRFLHHTPAEAMKSPTAAQESIKRAWRIACHREDIDPKHPQHLPLIFSLDSQLNIPNGFHYCLNCQNSHNTSNSSTYCAGDIGCASGCCGDSGSDSGCSGSTDSGCGGGCGGD